MLELVNKPMALIDARAHFLKIAAFYNDEIVKLLLNSGADIDKQNNKGYTALISAAS